MTDPNRPLEPQDPGTPPAPEPTGTTPPSPADLTPPADAQEPAATTPASPAAAAPRATPPPPPPPVWTPPAGDATDVVPTPTWTPPGSTVPAATAATPGPGDGPAWTAAEPSAEAVAVQPARSSGLRWAVALGIVAVLIVATAAAAVILTGSTPISKLAGWMPADSVIYLEARLDLPGDQAGNVSSFLSAFPGFEDQSSFDTKIDEALDQLLSAASDGEASWTSDIKPWFDGDVAVGMSSLPQGEDPDSLEGSDAVVGIAVKDEAAAEAWVDGIVGGGSSTETYAGAEVHVIDAMGTPAAWTISDGILFVGTESGVKAALDSGGNGLGATDGFKSAYASLDEDYVALLYSNNEAAYAQLGGQLDQLGALGASVDIQPVLDLLPPWTIAAMRFGEDSFEIDSIGRFQNALGLSTGRSDLLDDLPPSTFFFAEIRDLGTLIDGVFGVVSDMGLSSEVDQVEQTLAILGGTDAVYGWMDDAGVILTHDGSTVDGAIVIVPKDSGDAASFVTSLRGLLQLSGMDVSISQEDYNGATLTIVDAAGLGADLPPDQSTIVIGVSDSIVAIGLGTTTVKAIIDAGSGESLADDPDVTSIIDRAGGEGSANLWVDLNAFLEIAEAQAGDAGSSADFDELRPYLEPLDMLAIGERKDGDLLHQTLILTVD